MKTRRSKKRPAKSLTIKLSHDDLAALGTGVTALRSLYSKDFAEWKDTSFYKVFRRIFSQALDEGFIDV